MEIIKKHKKGIRIMIFGIAVLCVMLHSRTAFAWWWGTEDMVAIVEFLKSHSDWLKQSNLLAYIFHNFGWTIIKGVYTLVSLLEGLLNSSLELFDFIGNSGLNSLSQAIIKNVVSGLMVLTLIWIGIKMAVSKNQINFKSVVVNIMISAILFLGMPTLLSEMQNLSTTFYRDVQAEDGESGIAWTMVKENTADLVYVAENGFDLILNDSTTTNAKNGITKENFALLDLSSVLTKRAIDKADVVNNEQFTYLKYFLIGNQRGEFAAMEFSSGNIFSIFSDSFDIGYFRYPCNFWTIIVGLLALGIAYIFTVIVFGSTAYEIGIKRIVGLFVFATDLESGERTKMVVQDIMNGFILIAMTGVTFRTYQLFLTYIGTVKINPILYVVAILAATITLLKGSSTIMKYFGVENGAGKVIGAALGSVMTAIMLKNMSGKKGGSYDAGASADDIADNKDGSDYSADPTGNQDMHSINDGNRYAKGGNQSYKPMGGQPDNDTTKTSNIPGKEDAQLSEIEDGSDSPNLDENKKAEVSQDQKESNMNDFYNKDQNGNPQYDSKYQKPKKNKFNNFDSRSYDYGELEKALLNNPKSENNLTDNNQGESTHQPVKGTAPEAPDNNASYSDQMSDPSVSKTVTGNTHSQAGNIKLTEEHVQTGRAGEQEIKQVIEHESGSTVSNQSQKRSSREVINSKLDVSKELNSIKANNPERKGD